MADQKVYTKEEIKKIAPNYRGKPANFKPNFRKDKEVSGNPPKRNGPQSPVLPPPGHLQTTEGVQRNEPIIAESIFGVDVSVTEIQPRQNFSCNYAKLIDLATETFDAYRADEKQLDRKVERVEMSYYATALLHLRLIEVKSKQGEQALTSAEKDLRKATATDVFNVPQPLFAYYQQIGTYTDKMGKETRLATPDLPVTVVQNMGGYHAAAINAETHNLFEEVPSLGIAGDVVMALAAAGDNPRPNFRVEIPANSRVTNNLVGNLTPLGPRRPEIIQRLAGYGITAEQFPEYVPNTRFNLRYIRGLSDIFGQMETFKVEKVTFQNLGLSGGEAQAITTRPKDAAENMSWTDRSVQPTSAATSSTAIMGAGYCFGFQLFKEDGGAQADRAAITANWSCLAGEGEQPWQMPNDWYQNRNHRRNLPPGIGTERFRAISIRQDLHVSNVVRRMIKTQR